MLTRLCGRPATTRDPQAARRLVAACGHLPLAIRVAAARLRSRPAWQVRDLADRLAAEHRRLDWLSLGDIGVTATLESSHAHLTAAQARALRLLAVPDAADFGLPVAAALLDLPECEAGELCESLTDAAHLPVSYAKEAAEVARRMLGEGLDERTEGRVRALLGGLVADGAPSNTWPLAPTIAGPRTADAT